MKKKKLIHVGTFGNPYGLKGEININIFTSTPESFSFMSKNFIDDKKNKFKFNKFRKVGKNYIISLYDCDDRDSAQKLKGKKIFCERKNFPLTENNQYYVSDLIGCKVVNLTKNILGEIISIQNFGAGDLIEVQNVKKQKFYIPMNNENLISVNLKQNKIIVDPLNGLIE